ncbi:MAG: type II toxin-antitoxin system VapC family toxin [Candidatus Methylomirabilia bacterium]
MPGPLVVDASVVLKWQLEDEQAVAHAVALRDDFLLHGRVSLAAPSLLIFELTNAMVTATRQGRLSRHQAEEGLATLLATGIRLVPVDASRIFSLSLEWKVSAYDGAYLALAEKLDSEVWTGDRAFYTACRRKGSRVRSIVDYPTARH